MASYKNLKSMKNSPVTSYGSAEFDNDTDIDPLSTQVYKMGTDEFNAGGGNPVMV